jgi:RND family efflux transporter MFP subunit
VVDYIDLTGTVSAYQSADLVARVEGYLEKIHFEDGAHVDEGQLLFTIEQDSYQQKLKLHQAQLLRAQEEYDRQGKLYSKSAGSKADVEEWLARRDEAAAEVALAQINLGYTSVKAPFSGLMGRHLVDVGNLVGLVPGEPTKLAAIEQVIPIYVYFNVSSRDALRIREAMRSQGIAPKAGVGSAPVLVGLENESGYPHEGVLDFRDNRVSLSTGTIQLRAVFKNTDKTLFPGLFARVRLPLGKPGPQLMIPNAAVLSDQAGSYALVVNSDDTVARRSIEAGLLFDGQRAVTKGLQDSERVIVDGFAKVRPGQKVQLKQAKDGTS